MVVKIFSITMITLLFIFTSWPNEAKSRDIYYADAVSTDYVIVLLEHVLNEAKSGTVYRVKPSKVSTIKAREFDVLNANDGIDIIAGGSTPDREAHSQAIHFPLLKGLYGWRIALVNKNNVNLFENVTSLEQFKKLMPGQFHLWSDTQILEANNIDVVKGTNNNGLFVMLHKNRFDYFPRAASEIDLVLKNNAHLNITADPYALIHYPTAYYYYVRQGDDELATDILFGLEKLHADGRFEQLFTTFFGDVVHRIENEQRRIFSLKNPLLSSQTPIQRSDLWLDFKLLN